MKFLRTFTKTGIFGLMAAMISVGCGGDDNLVVEGIVLSIDSGRPAVGVKVYLYDADNQFDEEYASQTATGSDGSFTLQIPKDVPFYLVTDDFTASDGNWLPYINPNPAIPTATEDVDLTSILIHACPEEGAAEFNGTDGIGTIATLDLLLQTEAVNPWTPTSLAAENSGFFFIQFWTVSESASIQNFVTDDAPLTNNDDVFPYVEGMSVNITNDGFGVVKYSDPGSFVSTTVEANAELGIGEADILTPFGAFNGDHFCDGNGIPLPDFGGLVEPLCLGQADSGTSVAGQALAVGPADYSGNTITVETTDNNPLNPTNPYAGFGVFGEIRTDPWSIPDYTFPVQNGFMTYALIGCIDGACDKDVKDVFVAQGIL